MELQIARSGSIIGTLQSDDLAGAVAAGTVFTSDHGWHEGLSDWQLIGEMLQLPEQRVPLDEIEPPLEKELVASETKKRTRKKRDWRQDPATAEQIASLSSYGLATPAGITKGEAADIIGDCPATEKQIAFLATFGATVQPGITRAQAGDMIERAKNDPQAMRIHEANRFLAWERASEESRQLRAEEGAYSFHKDVLRAKEQILSYKNSRTEHQTLVRLKQKEIAALERQMSLVPDAAKERIEHQIIVLDVELSKLESEPKFDPEDLNAYEDELKQAELIRVKFWKATFKADWINSNDAAEFEELVDVASTINRLSDEYGQYFRPPTGKQIADILESLDNASADWDQLEPSAFFARLHQNFPGQMRQPNENSKRRR
jgi:hypothetical protein